MPKTYAIILAGGKGERVAGELPKQFLNIKKHPIIAWSLSRFNKLSGIARIVVVIPRGYDKYIKNVINDHNIKKVEKIVYGGTTRQGSSYNAIQSIEFNDDDILVFHDAARPFVKEEIIAECIGMAAEHGSAGVYTRAVDTIAESDGEFIQSIPIRDKLYYTQTPQAFRFKIIRQAHELALSRDIHDATDDAGLVTGAGYRVRLVQGDPGNIKITTMFDLQYANQVAEWD